MFDQKPQGLQPLCGHKHAIVFKEGSGLVTLGPRWYPHHQKDET